MGKKTVFFLKIYLFVRGRGGERRRVCKQGKEQRKREKEYQVYSDILDQLIQVN